MLMDFLFMSDLSWFFPKGDLFSSDNLQHFPADFSMIFVETFQVRSDIRDNFSRLIFLN